MLCLDCSASVALRRTRPAEFQHMPPICRAVFDNWRICFSYAWGDDEYQNLVLAFAGQLLGDGIEVILDKWDLTEGNDTFAFMEKCATDPTVTNVLMLLDPIYAKKADEHTGGVGAETQIISASVYSEVSITGSVFWKNSGFLHNCFNSICYNYREVPCSVSRKSRCFQYKNGGITE